MAITQFRREYSFLSNFYLRRFVYKSFMYSSAEHAYQGAKCMVRQDHDTIAQIQSPASAKKLGKLFQIRPNWDQIKISLMKEILMAKFSYSRMQQLLLATGDEELIEGNTWYDTFWGVCNGVGENHLGKILMEIRIYYGENPNGR
jgi:ribA/ribD-fused uncharacterized protein